MTIHTTGQSHCAASLLIGTKTYGNHCNLGFMFETADGFKILAAILLLFSLECYLLHEFGSPLLIGNVLIGIIGAVNLHFGQRKRTYAKLRLAQAEVEHLAKLAERERIARDLHDVLGHMLSLIILKSELGYHRRRSGHDTRRSSRPP